jgi:PST family polysaccharide transporter
MVWAFLSTAAGRFISLGTVAVLARLLVPADFGLLAFALVFIAYLETVGDLGTGMALIYWPTQEQEVAQVTFFVNLAMGFVWFTLTLLLAPTIAAFFGSPTGAPVLRALAWSFPIKALGNTHDALIQKGLRFRARLIPDLCLALGKAGIAIPLAIAGFGVWSLVWGQIVGLTLWTIVLWIVSPWRPRWSFSVDLARSMFSYGRGIVAVNVIAGVVHHSDVIVVGRILGAAALGFYQIAYKVPEIVVTTLVRVSSIVLFPAFARIHAGGQDLRDAYLAALRYISLVTVPTTGVLFLLAESLMLTVFGDQWRASIPILQALAVYAGLRALGSHAGDLLKATGRPGVLAMIGVVRAVILVPTLVVAARHGIVTVAVAMAGVTALTTVANLAIASRLVDVRAGRILYALWPSLAGGGALSLVLFAWTRLTGDVAPGLVLVGGACLGLGSYLLMIYLLSPSVFRDALRSLGQRRSRPGVTRDRLAEAK